MAEESQQVADGGLKLARSRETVSSTSIRMFLTPRLFTMDFYFSCFGDGCSLLSKLDITTWLTIMMKEETSSMTRSREETFPMLKFGPDLPNVDLYKQIRELFKAFSFDCVYEYFIFSIL